MAAVLPIAAEAGVGIAEKVAEKARETVDDIGKNPVAWVEHFCIKWGSVITLAGLGFYALFLGCKRASQGYLNDIDRVYGIPQETKATPPVISPKPVAQPVPATPPQIVFLNEIVSDLNTLGSTSAAANVALLQDSLTQLWGLANLVYKPVGSAATQTPVTGTNPTGGAFGLGPQLAIAIMQNILLILEFEGQDKSGYAIWQGQNWVKTDVYGVEPPPAPAGLPNGPDATLAWEFLAAWTAFVQQPFTQYAPCNWSEVSQLLSNVENPTNFKQTINGIAYYCNASQPFDLTAPPGQSHWGVLGAAVADFSAVGQTLETEYGTVASGIEAAWAMGINDLKQLGADVGAGLGAIAKTLENFPRLLGDGLGFAGTWLGEMIGEVVYPILLLVGGSLLAVGVTIRYVRKVEWTNLKPRLKVMHDARVARFWLWFDHRFNIEGKALEVWQEKAHEGMLEAAAAEPIYIESTSPLPVPKIPLPGQRARSRAVKPSDRPEAEEASPVIETGGPAEAQRTKPEKEGEAVSTAEVQPSPEPAKAEKPPIPAQISHETPTLNVQTPIPGGATTEETEKFLGENPTRAPTLEELKAQEAARLASMPPPPPPPPPPPGPTYRQRKEERDRARAERFVSMGVNWEAAQDLKSDAREVGRKEGTGTYQAGAEKRYNNLQERIEKMERSDGEEAKVVAAEARTELEEGRKEGEQQLLRGGKGPRTRKPVYRGFMEGASRERQEGQAA